MTHPTPGIGSSHHHPTAGNAHLDKKLVANFGEW